MGGCGGGEGGLLLGKLMGRCAYAGRLDGDGSGGGGRGVPL